MILMLTVCPRIHDFQIIFLSLPSFLYISCVEKGIARFLDSSLLLDYVVYLIFCCVCVSSTFSLQVLVICNISCALAVFILILTFDCDPFLVLVSFLGC